MALYNLMDQRASW